MEQRLSIITLGVTGLKKARAFYDALGWTVANEDQAGEIIAYNLQGMTLALYPLDKLVEDAKVPAAQPGGAAFTIAYNVRSEKEVDDTLVEAQKAGGRLVKPAEKVFWGGYSGYFADPDGHLWEVAFNPFSPLGADGAFQWGGA
ncbi:MAG: VOC family protein [Alphaproteobacteria bacterium]|nr:VOC family protein [Alphaproteobacteria bacterium]